MSSSSDPSGGWGGWGSTKVVPSIIFILTPVVAIGMLVFWSLRLQGLRRRYIAGLARHGRATSNNHLDEGDVPKMHEVWMGDSWWDAEQEGHRSGKQSIAAHGMNCWNTIMVIRSFIIYPR
jgi:hypothetical protein